MILFVGEEFCGRLRNSEDQNTARTAIQLQMLQMAIEKGVAMWKFRVAAACRLGKLDAWIRSDDHETLSE